MDEIQPSYFRVTFILLSLVLNQVGSLILQLGKVLLNSSMEVVLEVVWNVPWEVDLQQL